MKINILKITVLFVIIAGCVLACNDPKPHPNGNENPTDTTQIINSIVCEFENPLTDLLWLKEKTDEFQRNPDAIVAIYQCIDHNEQIVFFIEENEEKTFYSCEGEIYTEEVNIVNEELIWEQDGYTKGNVVGYTRCMDFVGYFIITEQRDSLLTFNLLSSSINIDFDTLKPGAYAMRWVNIKFDYRLAIGDEIKQNSEILCSQLIGVGGPPPPGRFEDYVQTIITDIKE